jgi:hypothetical protein
MGQMVEIMDVSFLNNLIKLSSRITIPVALKRYPNAGIKNIQKKKP